MYSTTPKTYTTLLGLALLLALGCNPVEPNSVQDGTDTTMKLKQQLQAAQEGAPQVFKEALGKLTFPFCEEEQEPIQITFTSQKFASVFGEKGCFILRENGPPTSVAINLLPVGWTKLLGSMRPWFFDKDGQEIPSQPQGALAACVYHPSLADALKRALSAFPNTEQELLTYVAPEPAPQLCERYLTLVYTAVQCTEALAQLVDDPATYESEQVDALLAQYEG